MKLVIYTRSGARCFTCVTYTPSVLLDRPYHIYLQMKNPRLTGFVNWDVKTGHFLGISQEHVVTKEQGWKQTPGMSYFRTHAVLISPSLRLISWQVLYLSSQHCTMSLRWQKEGPWGQHNEAGVECDNENQTPFGAGVRWVPWELTLPRCGHFCAAPALSELQHISPGHFLCSVWLWNLPGLLFSSSLIHIEQPRIPCSPPDRERSFSL